MYPGRLALYSVSILRRAVSSLNTSSVMLSLPPGTVLLCTFHTPSARLSCCPSGVRACAVSRPGSSFCALPASRSSPPSSAVRKRLLYHSTVSPESRAAG